MGDTLSRLAAALADRYAVERELRRGGMATVYLARDLKHDRPVAIKVLRPELATEIRFARFLQEIRVTAKLQHPHILPIHDSGEADGFLFYVMPYVEGESLADRLAREPQLPLVEALRLSWEVADGLVHAHERGVIHRDIKPANLLLTGGHAVIADFGIAKAVVDASTETLTHTGSLMGTPAYISPEQVQGAKELDGRTDLYSLACVLYEMLAGRRAFAGPTPLAVLKQHLSEPPPSVRLLRPEVPAAVDHAIVKALQKEPGDRFTTAEEFAGAIEEALTGEARRSKQRSPTRSSLRLAAGVVAAVALGAILTFILFVGRDGEAQLAILPCRGGSPADSELGEQIARHANYYLEDVLPLTGHHQAFRWAKQRAADLESVGGREGAAMALGAARVADCRLVPGENGRHKLLLDIKDARDKPVVPSYEVEGTAEELGERLARSVLQALHPRAQELKPWLEGYSLTAVKQFFAGESYWEANARRSAAHHFKRAVELDSSFALARWRLADVRRWIPAPPGENLDKLYAQHAEDLPERHRRLLEAKIAPVGPEQFDLYERLLENRRLDAYATLSYGDELLHRGPLWGIPPDSAHDVLKLAASMDSFLAPTYDHLAQAQIRLGRQEASKKTLRHLMGIYAGPEEDPFAGLWREGYRERFESPRSAGELDTLFRGPGGDSLLALAARYPLGLNLPRTQETLARMLIERSEPGLPQRTSGHVAAGLALMTAGRPRAALEQFDAAAQNHRHAEARLQAAQWRVVPPALGVPGFPPQEVADGRATLQEVAGDPSVPAARRAHAAWSLALANRDGPDTDAALRAAGEAAADAGEPDLELFLEALAAAREKRFQQALDLTAPLLAYDSVRRETWPFLRSALYLLRGEWYEHLGSLDSALVTLAWHQHMDLGGVWNPGASDEWSTLPRQGEVDWALGTVARLRRAPLLITLDRISDACSLLEEIERLWNDPEPGVARVLEQEVRALRRERCRSR